MRTMFLVLIAAGTALSSPAIAQGRGHGQGGGQGHGQAQGDRGSAQQGGGRHGGHGSAERGGGGRDRTEHAQRGAERPQQHGRGAGHAEQRAEHARGHDRAVADRGPGHARAVDNPQAVRLADRANRRVDRRAVVVTDRGSIARLRYHPGRGLIQGCPPGLARKHNGCLPPGQARHLASQRAWYDNLWRYPASGLYRYDGGYLWRLRPDGGLLGFVPVAGGALWAGNPWPARYAYSPVPDYHVDYFGYRDPYSYRYADGIIYGLDPQTQMIRQISGLVTGDTWSIGSRMPSGYDVYNVPNAYRDRYHDTPDNWYRYSDGYVYQVDPTTQLVQTAIQLIA